MQLKRKNDKSNLVIEEFVPTTSEYEELWRAVKRKNIDRFVEKLPIHAKDREIYSFCYHYEELQREFVSFNMKQKYGVWIAIRTESCRIAEQERVENAANGDVQKDTLALPSTLKPELMENMREDTQRMLLYTQHIPLTEEQRKALDDIMKIPAAAELYNEAMGVNGVAADVLFSSDMEESKRSTLVKLIVTYLSEPTQTRKANNDKGFTIQTTAQKSLLALLKEHKCLHPSIDTFNAKELHHLTSLFIEQKIGVSNVSYSSKYNEAEIFQNYNPDKLEFEGAEYKKYMRFKEFEEDFKKIIG